MKRSSFDHFDDAVRARFWAKVAVRGPDECWLWTAFVNDSGYGRFKIQGVWWRAHRVSLMLAVGRILSRSEFACHHCDNPPCVNPAHLFVGSLQDNTDDAVKKGRMYKWSGLRAGSSNPRAVLTDANVREILGSPSVSTAEFSERFGVSAWSIYAVRRGETWAHISRADRP